MAIKIDFDKKTRRAAVSEPESVSSLVRGHYGVMRRGTITLYPEETLYLMDIRNAAASGAKNEQYRFNQIAALLASDKLMARYFTYKDWRDRGLVARPSHEVAGNFGKDKVKKYTSARFSLKKCKATGLFFPDDLVTLIDDEEEGRKLYQDHWIGQFATYKAEQRGKLSKLDIYETVFMSKHAKLKVVMQKIGKTGAKPSNPKSISLKQIVGIARKARPDFDLMYEVYEDWRLRGYIVKTGFKFGCHFRLYLPHASPKMEGKEWVHSKHVIQVFPRHTVMLISEWARAIRVAHSVKKTFILAIPGKGAKARAKGAQGGLDFALFHRKNNGIENPKDDSPTYMMLSLSEEEYIGGQQLAASIEACKSLGLDLMMAIADRETAVTYYSVKRLELPSSKYEYYEIEWEQP